MPSFIYVIFCGLFSVALLMPHTCLRHGDTLPTEQAETRLMEEVAPVVDTVASFSVVSEGSRIALVEPCGRCHKSSLASHKPGAVAIFDLDNGEQWHADLNAETLNGLERRVKGNSSLSEKERKQIDAFVALKRNQFH